MASNVCDYYLVSGEPVKDTLFGRKDSWEYAKWRYEWGKENGMLYRAPHETEWSYKQRRSIWYKDYYLTGRRNTEAIFIPPELEV